MVNRLDRSRAWLLLVLMLVLVGAGSTAAAPPALYLEAELSPPDPYLQAEVVYDVRLYRSSSLLQGYLVMPELPDVAAEALERSEPEPVEVEGQRYELIRWRYLLYPQRSGHLTLPGAVYSGREVHAQGAPLVLEVRPPPANSPRPWLPARGLSLGESWRTPDPPWQAGEALERTLVIEAEGLTGAQLPPIALSALDGIEVQPLGTQIENHLRDGRLWGRRSERFRLIPQRPGRHELPAIALAWWDVVQDAPRQTTLAGRVLDIAAAPATSAAPPVTADMPVGAEVGGAAPFSLYGLLSSAAALLLTVGLLAAGYSSPWCLRGRERRRCLRRLSAACRRDDAPAAAAALRDWATAGDASAPRTLGALACQLEDDAAAQALWALDACLYGDGARTWQGTAFRRQIWPALKDHGRRRRTAPLDVLPPLNP